MKIPIDFEDEIRKILAEQVTAYCKRLSGRCCSDADDSAYHGNGQYGKLDNQ